VERALTLFAAPADDARTANADTFNRKWNKLVQKYREIIETKLQNGSMEDIVLRAWPFMKDGTHFSPSVTLSNNVDDMEDLDEYADI
jgi:hypothetical protein